MRLKAFKVENYKSILDSGWVEVDDVTVIVGKNESGKTALLQALHKFNPFDPDPYTLDREWPRRDRKGRSPDAVVVRARFDFGNEESREITELTASVVEQTGVEIARRYDGGYAYKLLPGGDVILGAKQEVLDLLRSIGEIEGTPAEFKERLPRIRDEAMRILEGKGPAAFREYINYWRAEMNSAIQESKGWDRVEGERAKGALDRVLGLIEIWDQRIGLEELITGWIPTFIYMDDHKPFRGSAQLNEIKNREGRNRLTGEDKTFLMMLEMAGLDFDEECRRADAQDREQRMLDMPDASSTLTNLLADHWSQREYKIRIEADGHHVSVFVSDEVDPALVSLNDRSRGFQWFFSFDTTFLHGTKGTFRNAVILLDEPGLHLHASAQRDLLLRLREYAKDNQLIYTTHMPFMIDMERLDDIRVCVESKDRGTTVSANWYGTDREAIFPLQAALGLSISQSLFMGPYNLVVEGVTDFWFLSAMAENLRSEGRSSLDERLVITPSGGATKAASVSTMLHGQRLNVVVLLDSDIAGKSVRERLIKDWIIKDRQVLLLGQILGRDDEPTLEDVFSDELYLRFVNDAYERELEGSPIAAEEIGGSGPIVRRVEEAFRARGMVRNSEGKAFNKGRAARRMLSELPKTGLAELPEETVENFRKLFMAINKAMPGLRGEAAS